MKSIIIILMMLIAGRLQGQVPDDIILNSPDLQRGLSVMKAFANRASATDFSSRALSLQDLSDLLWAANGINRAESGKKTAPSAMNAQDIDIYVFISTGTYLYEASTGTLKGIAAGDHRALVYDRQEVFANAPVMLVLVSDISRFRGNDNETRLSWAAMDAGIVSQNISLFCAGTGLITRPRAFMNREGIKELLGLSESQIPLLNNPVGFPVE